MGPAFVILGCLLACAIPSAGATTNHQMTRARPPEARLQPVSVRVPLGYLAVGERPTVAFRAQRGLPAGSYYYAVAVLVHYRALRSGPSPGCALSSDMSHTQYGSPVRGGLTHLTLLPGPSANGQWCQAGLYEGAVYAVPHRLSCTSAYPCYGRSSCGGPEGGVCGVVANPFTEYDYPGGLPRPIDRSARIVGRFTLRFAVAPESSGLLPAGKGTQITTAQAESLLAVARREAALNGDPHPSDIEAASLTHADLLAAGIGPSGPQGPAELLVVAMRGKFTCSRCSEPPGAGAVAATGTVVTLLVIPGSYLVTGFAFTTAYPSIAVGGAPVRLG